MAQLMAETWDLGFQYKLPTLWEDHVTLPKTLPMQAISDSEFESNLVQKQRLIPHNSSHSLFFL